MKFGNGVETWKQTQDEMKIGLENPVPQLENSKELFTRSMNQVEDRTSSHRYGISSPNKQGI